ncbi:kinase-like domain-containing protein [Favolaschia claudopus]|uniref:Kinase-like domain-containing protein n=1 Tax=Favolaschia claudopus TaxID=2862362 RepID=A0AAW0B6E2_9AGAR
MYWSAHSEFPAEDLEPVARHLPGGRGRRAELEKAEDAQPVYHLLGGLEVDEECLQRARFLSAGGYAEVYSVASKSGSRAIAMKQLRGTVDFKHVQREVKVISHLPSSELVVKFHGYSIRGPHSRCQVSLFFELVDFGSLATLIPPRRDALASEMIRFIIHQVNQGLAFLHKFLVHHRDVKPGNVLVTQTGLCKLADFGLSKIAGGSTSQTHSNIGTGTQEYLAPEALETLRYSLSSDIWAMGCLFQWLLTGRGPFEEYRFPIFPMMKHMEALRSGIINFAGPPLPSAFQFPSDQAASYRSQCFTFDSKNRPKANVLLQHKYFDHLDREHESARFCQFLMGS